MHIRNQSIFALCFVNIIYFLLEEHAQMWYTLHMERYFVWTVRLNVQNDSLHLTFISKTNILWFQYPTS